MCGIWAFVQKQPLPEGFDEKIKQATETLKVRGPDNFQIKDISNEDGSFKGKLAFARLAVNGLTDAGNQPFSKNNTHWVCNGEIYNHQEIEQYHGRPESEPWGSDCEALGYYFINPGNHYSAEEVFKYKVYGVYAFASLQGDGKSLLVARDPYGLRPCYWMENEYGVFVGSLRKSLEPLCGPNDLIYEFPPGEAWVWDFNEGQIKKTTRRFFDIQSYTLPTDDELPMYPSMTAETSMIKKPLEKAIAMRTMSDRPIGALLSGGLDSSLVAAILQQWVSSNLCQKLKTFSIGMEGSTDLAFARIAANYIQSDHTEVVVTADEMFDAIPAVIKDIESFDITTVRASVGNWMICKYISENSDCKVIFNGDGADELFGSYLYFFNAPSAEEYNKEVQRLLSEIYRYDALRSDRCIAAHGLDARTPYLDKDFTILLLHREAWQRKPLKNKMIEKWLLRNSFVNPNSPSILPPEVLWRRKEAFSDGVSSKQKSWFEDIKERIISRGLVPSNWRDIVQYSSDPLLKKINPPTEEAYYYYQIYSQHFKHTGDPMPYWMPKWSPETTDPSARTLANY